DIGRGERPVPVPARVHGRPKGVFQDLDRQSGADDRDPGDLFGVGQGPETALLLWLYGGGGQCFRLSRRSAGDPERPPHRRSPRGHLPPCASDLDARYVYGPRPPRPRHAVAGGEVAHVRASRHVLARAAIRLQPRLPGSLPPVARLAHSRDRDRGPPDAAVFPRAVSILREQLPLWCHRILLSYLSWDIFLVSICSDRT